MTTTRHPIDAEIEAKRALLVAVETKDSPWPVATSLEELAGLCESDGLETVDRLWQRVRGLPWRAGGSLPGLS